MQVAVASDHAGYPLKQHLVTYLQAHGYEVIDLGVDTPDISADYPDAAVAVAQAILDGRAERGILACGSGVGACIAANKFTGIYAGIAHDTYSAHQGVEHDQMNVVCMGSRIIGQAVAEEIAQAFLAAEFNGGERYVRRFNKIQAIERGDVPGSA